MERSEPSGKKDRAGLVSGHEGGRSAGRDLELDADLHARVVREGVDVPEQRPSFALPLTRVGISGKTVWVMLPQGRLPFAAAIEVDLPGHRRGIHMSRIEEVIGRLYDREFSDLRSYAQELARQTAVRQQAACCRVDLSGRMPLLRNSPVSDLRSVDTVEIDAGVLFSRGESGQDTMETTVGAGVHHITACPCTQAYNRVLFGEGGGCPLPTHSQRSVTRLTIAEHSGRPSYAELLACLDDALHVTQDLLKRPDEAELVLRSHRRPQFIEDAVRETAKAVGVRFAAVLPDETTVRIEALSLESIHIHDVCCRLEVTLAGIRALL